MTHKRESFSKDVLTYCFVNPWTGV